MGGSVGTCFLLVRIKQACGLVAEILCEVRTDLLLLISALGCAPLFMAKPVT